MYYSKKNNTIDQLTVCNVLQYTSNCPVTAAHLDTEAGTVALPSKGPRNGCNDVYVTGTGLAD